MRCFKARQASLTACRRCSLSTSCVALALPLRIETHNLGGISVAYPCDAPIRTSYPPSPSKHLSETWFADRPPPAPMVLASAPPITEISHTLQHTLRKEYARTALFTDATMRCARARSDPAGSFLFTSTGPESEKDIDPVSRRKLNMGKTIDILKERLPTLLQSPLPSEILSPSITLQLFPSTHPHLPSVRGRMAYIAALWTSPVVWGRIPGLKVRLEILSIKMIKGGIPLEKVDDGASNTGGEQMIVKWRTTSSPNGNGNGNGNSEKTTAVSASDTARPASKLGNDSAMQSSKEDPISAISSSLPKITLNGDFCGLFIFEFDEFGKVKTHIIEDVEGDRGEAKQQHSRVITLTEWLLKKAKGSLEEKPQVPGLAFQRIWGDLPRNRFS
ncbi:hypothetical protein TWF694_003953 [Orbilia ellipsospora]|uniref:Uncharacterized protein n=1 Tax=Orbilia ellipsospora TaxID=2528407 RepID=A0AAV9WWN4_9PEZI